MSMLARTKATGRDGALRPRQMRKVRQILKALGNTPDTTSFSVSVSVNGVFHDYVIGELWVKWSADRKKTGRAALTRRGKVRCIVTGLNGFESSPVLPRIVDALVDCLQ